MKHFRELTAFCSSTVRKRKFQRSGNGISLMWGWGGNRDRYAKVVEVADNYESVKVIKEFEVPSWRPYSGKKWYDNLPWAYNPNPSEAEE